ncbi:hypothetical protein [Cellulosilyticum lentocellum]|uniref:Uncharacterized protein n=1 Tax=Cellulosilyticum lentocellum (strain ATCC 49066 / DSM 5427 / NCIMB 11756 / RHM5) TaxID=642492 RepID=F2JQU1_CELLD|nr:hypothetical protein [Cellulosilyticum lentocellum]ADZ82686.1 hypothetical protein Clole_0954 [Cellulosilyticum lentocellum DSM 5427]
MKRYFDLQGLRLTAELDIVNGSDAATAGIDTFKKYFKCDDVREVDRVEYKRLSKEYQG